MALSTRTKVLSVIALGVGTLAFTGDVALAATDPEPAKLRIVVNEISSAPTSAGCDEPKTAATDQR